MIRYALTCPDGHRFESWFQSAAAFDGLSGSGHLSCPVCGASKVEKALMAPGVQVSRSQERPDAPAAVPAKERPLSTPSTDIEARLARLRRKIEETSDYVGLSFAAEARKMHEGETPHRPIYGEAKPAEARQLIEDGVPVAPLPFLPHRKSN